MKLQQKNRIMELQRQAGQLLNWVNQDKEQTKAFELIISLSSQLNIMASNLQRTQAQLLDILTNANHGRMSPLMLTPEQLGGELIKIKGHLPRLRKLPLEKDHLINYYKILQVGGIVTDTHVIFNIKVPLIDEQEFELFSITAIPTIVSTEIVAIQPTAQYIAANAYRDQFISVTKEDLNRCITTKPDVQLCFQKNLRIGKEAESLLCERQLMINKTSNSCKLHHIANEFACIELKAQNTWLFASTKEIEFSAVCGTESLQFVLHGSGMISMTPNCRARNNLITLQSHFSANNSIHTTYTRFGDINAISSLTDQERRFNHTNIEIEKQLTKLTSLQKMLETQRLAELPSKVNGDKIHHYIISYTSLTLSTVIIICLLIWNVKKRQSSVEFQHQTTPQPVEFQGHSTPQPSPRNATSAESYMVNV